MQVSHDSDAAELRSQTQTCPLAFDAPAETWEQALPVGNGRHGVMVFGGVADERLALNEDSIWAGKPIDRLNPDARMAMTEIRRLIALGNVRDAWDLAATAVVSLPPRLQPYQPLGDLLLQRMLTGPTQRRETEVDASGIALPTNVPVHESYRRWLDHRLGVAETRLTHEGVVHQRTVFASAADPVVVVWLQSDKPGAIRFDASLERQLGAESRAVVDPEPRLELEGDGEGIRFSAQAAVWRRGGTLDRSGENLRLRGADEAAIILATETSFRHERFVATCVDHLEAALALGPQALFDRHAARHTPAFERCSFSLANADYDDAEPSQSSPPFSLADRVERYHFGGNDPQLDQHFFDHGRYLGISASRGDTLPANLQGVWNPHYTPTWDSKFTININLEMNYWPAEVCGLTESHRALFRLIERLAKRGRRTARKMYGCRGWCAHHNTDIWADTEPVDPAPHAALWPLGGAWLSTHLWDHYLFGRDTDFLTRVWPLMRDAAVFLLDYSVIDEYGQRLIGPSLSPENGFVTRDGEYGTLCMGNTCDTTLARVLWRACVEAGRLVDRDADFVDAFESALTQLPDYRVGAHGQLQEWLDDHEEAEPGHRHTSHLLGLYPFHEITLDDTPELARACRVALDRRLSAGGGHTCWSRAWTACLFARLRDPAAAQEQLRHLIGGMTLPNLFTTHPPFQIDGNFGGTAAIAEMLIQSAPGRIHLLPALPEAWSTGSFTGLRTRTGLTVAAAWEQGRLTRVSLTPVPGSDPKVRLAGPGLAQLHGANGDGRITAERNTFDIETTEGCRYELIHA